MIDRKKLIIIGVVASIGFLFFVLIVISAFTTKKEDPETTQVEPTSTELLIPTSSQTIPTALPEAEGIQLVSIDPPDGTKDLTILKQITMNFSSPMNERKFYYRVEPQTPTYIHTEGASIIISPQRGWSDGVTTITVHEASESVDGIKLSTPFQYTFETAPFPTPESGVE
ncbi:MAG: Ig-like domain-containing protein [Microgenomates group bacterium]